MSYAQFVNELISFPATSTFRTDLATLHAALNTLRERNGYDPLPYINGISIVDNEEAREAIRDLISTNLAGYGEAIFDLFMVGKVDISISKHGSTAHNVSIDIVLVHVTDLRTNEHFIEMQAAMTSEQVHRSYC